MYEEFIFQATEEELAEFPEQEGTEKQEEESCKGSKDASQKEVEKVNIPSLLDLKLPRLYATCRNGPYSRQDQSQSRGRRWRRRPPCKP